MGDALAHLKRLIPTVFTVVEGLFLFLLTPSAQAETTAANVLAMCHTKAAAEASLAIAAPVITGITGALSVPLCPETIIPIPWTLTGLLPAEGPCTGPETAATIISPIANTTLGVLYCEGASTTAAFFQVEKTLGELGKTVVLGDQTQSTSSGSYKAAKYKNRFGTAQLPYQSVDELYRARRTGAIVSGAAVQADVLTSTIEAFNRSTPVTGVAAGMSLSQSPRQMDVLAIFGGGDLAMGTPVQIADGENLIVNATNPLPLPPQSLFEISQGIHNDTRNQDIADTALAQHAMIDVLAEHLGIGTGQTNSILWQNDVTNGTGETPVQTVAVDAGHMSLMSVVSTGVQSRFAQPGYWQSALSSGKTADYRLMATAQALELEIRYLLQIAHQDKEVLLGAVLARMTTNRSGI